MTPPETSAATAALFDLDGTLLDSEPRSQAAWAKLFAVHEVPVTAEVLAGFAGRPGREVIAEQAAAFPGGRTAEDLFAEAVHYSTLPGIPAARPVPGGVALLRELRARRVFTAVVTSGTRSYAHGELAGLGVLDLLDIVVTADDVARGKPHPEGYLKACAALGTDPRAAVVFEDAPAGVAAAKSAGAYCVALTTTCAPELLTAADLVVADLAAVTWPVGPAAHRRA